MARLRRRTQSDYIAPTIMGSGGSPPEPAKATRAEKKQARREAKQSSARPTTLRAKVMKKVSRKMATRLVVFTVVPTSLAMGLGSSALKLPPPDPKTPSQAPICEEGSSTAASRTASLRSLPLDPKLLGTSAEAKTLGEADWNARLKKAGGKPSMIPVGKNFNPALPLMVLSQSTGGYSELGGLANLSKKYQVVIALYDTDGNI